MELRHLRSFVAVAERLHFGRAARAVHLSQPALSKQIRQLEEETGVRLFERERPHIVLTPAGRALLPHARALLADSAAALVEARQVQAGLAGPLVLGFVPQAVFATLPRLIRQIQQLVPQATVQLRELPSAAQLQALTAREIDLALVQTAAHAPGLQSATLARERFAIVFSRAHRLAGAATVSLKDFLDDTVFVPRHEDEAGTYDAILQHFTGAGAVPAQLQTVERVQTAICLAAANLGVALVPESARAMRMEHALFRRLRGITLPIATHAVWRADDTSPLVDAVARQLLRHHPVHDVHDA